MTKENSDVFYQLTLEMVKGIGSGRVKIGPVKIVKFQSRKIIDVVSFLICLNSELSETRYILTLCLF